jgi:hypothetical protein
LATLFANASTKAVPDYLARTVVVVNHLSAAVAVYLVVYCTVLVCSRCNGTAASVHRATYGASRHRSRCDGASALHGTTCSVALTSGNESGGKIYVLRETGTPSTRSTATVAWSTVPADCRTHPPLQIDSTCSAPAPPRRPVASVARGAARARAGCTANSRRWKRMGVTRSALTFRAAKVRARNHRRPGLATFGRQDQQRNRGQEGIRGHGLVTWGCAAPATAGDHAKLQRGCRPAAPAHAPPGAEAVRLPRLFPPALSHPVVVYGVQI